MGSNFRLQKHILRNYRVRRIPASHGVSGIFLDAPFLHLLGIKDNTFSHINLDEVYASMVMDYEAISKCKSETAFFRYIKRKCKALGLDAKFIRSIPFKTKYPGSIDFGGRYNLHTDRTICIEMAYDKNCPSFEHITPKIWESLCFRFTATLGHELVHVGQHHKNKYRVPEVQCVDVNRKLQTMLISKYPSKNSEHIKTLEYYTEDIEIEAHVLNALWEERFSPDSASVSRRCLDRSGKILSENVEYFGQDAVDYYLSEYSKSEKFWKRIMAL